MFDLNTSYPQNNHHKNHGRLFERREREKKTFLHLKHVKIENVAILSKAWNFNGSLQMSADLYIMPHMHCAFWQVRAYLHFASLYAKSYQILITLIRITILCHIQRIIWLLQSIYTVKLPLVQYGKYWNNTYDKMFQQQK